jgi:hypothetical protein
MSKPIYIVTMILLRNAYSTGERCECGIYHSHRKRLNDTDKEYEKTEQNTVGWFADIKDAIDMLETNGSFVADDFYYNYAVIEVANEGPLGSMDNDTQRWFMIDNDTENYIECECPESQKCIVMYWG